MIVLTTDFELGYHHGAKIQKIHNHAKLQGDTAMQGHIFSFPDYRIQYAAKFCSHGSTFFNCADSIMDKNQFCAQYGYPEREFGRLCTSATYQWYI